MGSERLERLGQKANRYHREAMKAWRGALNYALRAGEALSEARMLVKHGQWDAWLRDNFEASPRTARDYMRISTCWTKPAVQKAVRSMEVNSIAAFLAVLRKDKEPVSEADQLRQSIIETFAECLESLDETELVALDKYLVADIDEWGSSQPDLWDKLRTALQRKVQKKKRRLAS